jgi:hypothetical protein
VNPDVLQGWNKRNWDWQFSAGIQHQLVQRVSLDVNYSRRWWGNFYLTQNRALTAADYDEVTLTAPVDPRLPNGGGYPVTFLERNNRQALGVSDPYYTSDKDFGDETHYWHGVDVTLNARMGNGLSFQGGTSTGRAVRDTCDTNIDTPNVKGRVGNELAGGCINPEPFLTNVRGNVSYTIPWIDVLASGVFQYRPGPARSANLQITNNDIIWEQDSAARAGTQFFGVTGSTSTQTVNLLDNNDLYGEGLRLFDLTFRKNLRFAGKRLSLGLDVYNIFNSDGPLAYNNTYTAFRQPDGSWVADNPATPTVAEVQDWGRITQITNPRFARFSMTFDF